MKVLLGLAATLGMISLGSLVAMQALPRPTTSDVTPEATPRRGVHVEVPEQYLGRVGLNADARGTFTIVNDSDEAVTLSEPMKSCSCTSAELEKHQLAPGQRCSLQVLIKTGERRVPRVETVGIVYSSTSGSPGQLFAKIYFEPRGVFEVSPADVTLTRKQPRATFRVEVDPAAGPYKVLAVQSSHRCVKVDASKLPEVTVELDLTTPDESILNVECVVTTNHPAEGSIRVPVRVHAMRSEL